VTVSKRAGKTHGGTGDEVTPPPVPWNGTSPGKASAAESGRVRESVEGAAAIGRARSAAKSDRSGPIGISGGDFATPSARKRTITQPRGLPVVSVPVPSLNATPPPLPIEGALPDSPFGSEPPSKQDDPAARLTAEAAAVRALDSGPLTPPPEVDDPGPTPPPELNVASAAPAPSRELPTPSPSDGDTAVAAVASPPSIEAAIRESVGDVIEQDFSSRETPWPELSGRDAASAGLGAPPPGAIPTSAMGADSSGGVRALEPDAVAPPSGSVEDLGGHGGDGAEVGEGDVAAVDDLEVVDGVEHVEHGEGEESSLDALPPEALADAGPGPTSGIGAAPTPAVAPPPAPRGAAAPPPLPVKPRTSEMRKPEAPKADVPAAQVVASLVHPTPPGMPILPEALAQRPRRPKRSKPWFEEVFDEDYLRTLPFMSADQTLREVEFIEGSLTVPTGGQVLDIGCGYGRHAIELVQRGLDVTGLDLSLPLLIRAADEAQRRALSVNFVHADMREMAFEKQFDGAYSMLTSFGYFDEEANLRVAEGIAKALKPGGRLLLDLVNRDYIVGDLPSRVWWEGNGCVVLEEVDFNFHTSRILTHRSIVFEDGRQLEQEISVRAFSLHEIGRLLRQAGFRVLDISGSLATRGHFFGSTSRNLLILAEKRAEET
jgi:SAM-dependent methyltransferase